MDNIQLHIVALDVPFPPNYGGAIDIFYRIKALHALGVKITLHCFEYGRGQQRELEKYTEQVYYYKRKRRVSDLLGPRPFIVKSRISNELLTRLLADRHPILFEGLHTAWYLEHPDIQQRITFLRAHNIEHEYYFGLMENSSRIKRLYFHVEHRNLKRYESILKHARFVLPIREGDLLHFRSINPNSLVLPASLPEFSVSRPNAPSAPFCLFHGNLSVPENHQAALWIMSEICPKIREIRFIIAGKSPSHQIVAAAALHGVELISNPDDATMQTLLQQASIHLLYTTQATGLKLKLLAALQTHGEVVVNPKMLDGSDLHAWCHVAHSPDEFASIINALSTQPFEPARQDVRISTIQKTYNTIANCRLILDLILTEGTRNQIGE